MYAQNADILFEKHKSLINKAIWRNRPLLAALRLEDEDVAQQLAIAMLSAIRKFNPDRSASIAAHIRCSLQYEILSIKRRHKPHGVTGVPKDRRLDFLYLDNTLPDGSRYELPSNDDVTAVEFSELLESLSEPEAEAVRLKIKGYRLRRKTHTSALSAVRRKYVALYGC